MEREDVEEEAAPLIEEASAVLADAPSCMALDADRQRVAVATYEKGIFVLDAQQLRQLHHLPGHAGGTLSLGWGRADVLVSAGEDGRLRLWDAASGREVAAFECEGKDADRGPAGNAVQNVAVSPDGMWAACSSGRTVHLVPLEAGDVASMETDRCVFPPVGAAVEALRFTTQGNTLLAGFYGGVMVWGTTPGSPGLELPVQTAIFSIAATGPSGNPCRWLVGGCLDAAVRIWGLVPTQDADQGEGVHVSELAMSGYDGKVTALDFDHRGELLASCGGLVNTVWGGFQSAAGGPQGTMPTICFGHAKPLTCQAWMGQEPGLLATGGKDGRVLLFDVAMSVAPEEGHPPMTLPVAAGFSEGDEVVALAWGARQPGELVSAHASGAVKRWRWAAEQRQGAAVRRPGDGEAAGPDPEPPSAAGTAAVSAAEAAA